MDVITRLKETVRVGKAENRHNLSVFPLYASWPQKSHVYVPFGVAAAKQLVQVTEVSQGGSVPTLVVRNLAPVPVLLIDGEELIGAKQNRIVNLSILVPADSKLEIPVSCVEHGRWNYSRPDFETSDRTMYARGRARKMMDVSVSRSHGGYASDQSAVWGDIALRASELSVSSPTGAMSEIFNQKRISIEEYLTGIVAGGDQVGAAFAINGSVVGFELFEAADVFEYYLPKIVRSYALEALSNRGALSVEIPAAEQVLSLFQGIGSAKQERFPALGYGEDVRLNSDTVAGAALNADGDLVHLVGFSKEITKSENGSSSPSRRGRSLGGARRGSSGTQGGAGLTPRGEQYPLRIVNNHLLADIDGRLALIDTASPVSFGNGRTVRFEGRAYTPSSAGDGILEIITQQLNTAVEWLIGYDVLHNHRVLIDWPAQTVTFGAALPRGQVTTSIPVRLLMGVPTIDASFNGRSIRAVLDSGAALSYAPPSVVQRLAPAGSYQDFYPGLGEFTVETGNGQVRVGERVITVRVGVLPPLLMMTLGLLLSDDGWILGVDFFRDRKIMIDYARHRILDIAPQLQFEELVY